MKNSVKTLITVLITVISTLLISAVCIIAYITLSDLPFEKLMKVISVVESSSIYDYKKDEGEEAAINAVLATLGDKYAVYYDEKNAKELMQEIDGYYIGIGTEIFANTEKGYIEVISAYEDSPADKAGIKNGDFIIAIDNKKYTASTMADAVSYMKGINVKNPLEKEILITLLRGEKEISVSLKREKINMYKVKSCMYDDICYIRYSGFTDESTEEIKKIVESVGKDVSGIVVDVRNNPGGEFDSSIELCDLFMESGSIMYTVDNKGNKVEYTAKKGSCDLPVAVLVNKSTASAAEIFAGALQANKRAVIVGEKTYGKGVTQTVSYLNPLDESEGALKLTTAKNYTSEGKWINECISPDVVIENTQISKDISTDEAFLAAVKCLKEDK